MNGLKDTLAFRPQWLAGTSPSNQQKYEYLMQQMTAREAELKQLLGNSSSLKTYASARVQDWTNSALGTRIDPDRVSVICRFNIRMAGRTLVQEDKRSLLELALFGLHDQNNRFQMKFEGHVPSGLTQARLENWLSGVDIRSDYFEALRKSFNDYGVQIALLGALVTRVAFSAFSATLQGHLNQPSMEMVERFIQGDRSISASAFVLKGYQYGFRDLMVFQQKSNPYGPCALYAPGSPGGRDWYSFPNIRELEFQVAGWVRTDDGVNFLTSQTHPQERGALSKYVKQLQQLPSAWKGAMFFAWPEAPEGILAEAIFYQISWDLAQENLVQPAGYRKAPADFRQRYARLNTELKALYTVNAREAGIVPYETFCRDLIKKNIEDLLKASGEIVVVNPDEIIVELEQGEKVSLSRIIIKETPFYAHEREGELVGVFPRFRVNTGHPALRNLDIRHLANWSRTLRPGEKYIAMLRSVYLNTKHPDYELKREIHFRTQQAEMYRAVLSSQFSGEMSSGLADQLNRLIAGMDKVTDPSFPPFGETVTSVQHSAVFKLHLKRCLIEGVYVFRLVESGKLTEILYTPNAPGGVHFRPMNQLFASIKENGLGQYLYERVKYIEQPIIGTFVNNIEFKNISENPPVLEMNSRVQSLRASYNARIERVISDVDAQTTSLGEIIGKLVYDSAVLAATVVSMVIPPVGLALSAVQITKNVFEGAQAYKYGDRATAFNHFKDALLDLASLVPGGKEATKAQKTLIQLLGDANTVVGLVASATGQSLGYDRFQELLEDILKEESASDSQTLLL
ncbi:DUF6543 domain-containing protein [Pseudomonas sp. HS6]|uniref:dermonecrotic toxin domain-containing protein n=1 Tax=Pseudomonas sp. HS6 TaxID=2850559 RepID=UPI002018D417|nr:DUF6543 domain-containing protein [Pseudomonas sp. HS6]UQS15810.1 hypothetical protein JJN09_02795 [Pseudomonas sp. HS6]